MPKLSLGRLKLTLIISFCLLLLFLPALFLLLQHPTVLAQVASGDINILDIVMDSGGGSRESGSGANRVILANTSIGESVGGSFVVSGDTTVCAGHACKQDYDYDPGRQPTLQQLIINASQDAVAKGRYGVSGLRADDEGGNYYNALSIQPQFSGVASDIELAGAAFTENLNLLSTTLSEFKTVLDSADNSKGFVVIYANKNKNLSGGPRVGRCGFNFCSGFYYVYLDGKWSRPLEVRNPPWSTKDEPGFPKDRIVESADEHTIRLNTAQHDPPLKLAFKVYFKKELGSNTWGTYGFALTSTSLAGSITNATPVPAATSLNPNQTNAQSISPGSEFYLFSLF